MPHGLTLLLLQWTAGSLAIWAWIAWRCWRGQAAIAFSPRRDVPWSGIDLLAVLLVYIAVHGGARRVVEWLGDVELPDTLAEFTPSMLTSLLVAGAVASVVVAAAAVGLAVGVRRAAWSDLGLARGQLATDLGIGAAAFVASLAPVYCVRWLVVEVYHVQQPVHPIMRVLNSELGGWALAVATLAAVVVAPVVEEFLFRVMFQGWLEKRLGRHATLPLPPSSVHDAMVKATDAVAQLADSAAHAQTAIPAIVASSVVFASFHASNWPDPVPLFFLAVILGYVYHRTHRILPCVVVHSLFNGLSLLAAVAGAGEKG